MYGKKFMGIKRTTVLISPKGKIIKIWNNVKVKDHAKIKGGKLVENMKCNGIGLIMSDVENLSIISN